MKKQNNNLKIIVAGDGKVGETLIGQLSEEGYDLTLIDRDRAVLDRLVETYDVIAVNGNCAVMEVLAEAGADKADVLIAATGSDEVNLLCCATAHSMNPKLHTIARIRDPEYTEQAYRMRDIFSLSMIFNPERMTAIEIERLIKYPGFLKRDTFAKGRLEIVEFKIDGGSPLSGVALSDIYSVVKCRVLVCIVLRDGQAIAPSGNFVLREGDIVFATAPTDELAELLKNLGIVTKRARRVMLIGGGTICYYLAEELLRSGISVKVIERDEERCAELSDMIPDADIIFGDARLQSVLESEGLAETDALVTLTNQDEQNILISLYAKGNGVGQVITKLGRFDDTKIITKLELGSVVSPRLLCCNNIVRYVRAIRNQAGAATAVHGIADGFAEAIEFQADQATRHLGEPLKSIRFKSNVLIAGISRGGTVEIPRGDSTFAVDDSIVVITSRENVLLSLNDIFED